MPSEYDALLDAQPAQQKSEYDALLEQPKQEGGVLSGIAAGIGRALNPINLIKGALDIGGESDISKISRYSHSLADIVSGKPVQESLQANIPEVAQQRAALTGQLGGREQAAEITGLGLQAGLLALPFAHGKLATLRETAFGKTEAPLASETAAAEVAKPEVQDRQLLVQPERRFTIVDEPPPDIAPTRNIMETSRYQPTSRPGEEPPLVPQAFPSISQSAEEARRVARTTETGIQSETAKIGGEPSATQEGKITEDSIVQHQGDGEGGTSAKAGGSGSTVPSTEVQTQKIGGESEKVQVQREDEGKREEGVLTPDAAKVQPPAAGGPSIAQVAKRPITPPESGEAVGWEQTTDQGHDWLDKGGDPSKLIDDFRRTGKVSVPIMGRMNAALDRIQATTNAAGDALDKAPNDPALQAAYETAKQNEQTFTEAYKPMHTVASNTLRSLQGERPLTEEMAQSYTGLNRRFIERMGRDFTPEESTKARKLTEKTKTVNKEYVDKTQELYKRMETEYGRIKGPRGTSLEDLAQMFRENLNEVCDV